MANLKQIPLTLSGHTRPVVHLDFSDIIECGYFLISACKGKFLNLFLFPPFVFWLCTKTFSHVCNKLVSSLFIGIVYKFCAK